MFAHIAHLEKEEDYAGAAMEMYKLNSMFNDCITCQSNLVRLLRLGNRQEECMRVRGEADVLEESFRGPNS